MLETLSFCKVQSWESFHESVSVWLKRPNVCYRILSCCSLQPLSFNDDHSRSQSINDIPLLTQNFSKEVLVLSNAITCVDCKQIRSFTQSSDESDEPSFVLRKLIPRRPDIHSVSYELVVILKSCFVFIPLNSTTFLPENEKEVYVLQYTNCCLMSNKVIEECSYYNSCVFSLSVTSFNNTEAQSSCKKIRKLVAKDDESSKANLTSCLVEKSWLVKKLFPTLCKWCEEKNKKKARLTLPPSLSLLDQEKYSFLYLELKRKYGVPLSQIWPEVTDPQKFVYEDVAIATYLLLLWEKERTSLGKETKQSFADLGCGNGLLVYILTGEGHNGVGYDIRKRNIWSMYGKATDLREATVTPDDLDLVKDYDWLLGNHSDELTPWLPIMAARCGYDKRYWVLPCCFYDLYGKYERAQSTLGQYDAYLSYVKDIGAKCGYEVETDVMRIPSTKRVCFVGMRKSYEESDHENVKSEVEDFIQNKRTSVSNSTGQHLFSPRPAQIEVRNCTKINRDVQDEVVRTISSHLLTYSNRVQTTAGKEWNRGGKIALSIAVALLTDDIRTTMKRECGGLQTLLRNHNQVFEISGGEVQLRNWASSTRTRKRKKGYKQVAVDFKKTKSCWFFNFHPDGCPRTEAECSFLHVSEKATHT